MNAHHRTRLVAALLAILACLAMASPTFAQRRGGGGGRMGGGGFGGARPSMGGGGFGGARPSMGGGYGGARPSMPRPNVSRPSMGGGYGGARPSMPNVSRPAARPSMPNVGGGARPGMPNVSRPSLGPSTRPSLPGGGQPGLGNLPGAGSRPGGGPGNVVRPGGDRPGLGTLPSRPGGGDRPGLGNLPGRPGGGDRPGVGTLPSRPGGGEGPGLGGLRPGGGNRPGIGDRPNIGGGDRPIIGGGNRPGGGIGGGDRPIIGGGDRPIIGNRPGGGNINIGNIGGGNINIGGGGGNTIIGGGNNIANRPGWGVGRPGWGWGGAGWGWGGPGWGNAWANGWVNGYHRGWYHGAWSGNWANYWYVPLVFGATAWGLGALSNTWGYGYDYAYANPYYAAPVAAESMYFDYSQPIVLQSYADGGQAAAPAEPSLSDAQQTGYATFDQARAAFLQGDYQTALSLTEQAIQSVPDDPVLHEFGALALFALGDYQRAAAVLNALLAVAPGMDWATMSQLYPNVDVYTQQLRALEAHIKANPDDAAALFVVAYHYLVAGHTDAAVRALQRVVAAQPQDQVAQRILSALTAAQTQPEAAPTDAAAPPTTGTTPPAEAGPTTDLVGTWSATRDGTAFELTITEAGQFTWKATPRGKEAMTVNGQYGVDGDVLILEGADKTQGTMAGPVTSGGPDQFTFVLAGGPPNDPGLTFQRVGSAG